ncbi:EamA family transporter [Marinomonas transparens]|uniref:EamA family transporter n=1 Tax=Marinomonas transparens TaxID=2795388 RepID=A0A934JRI0_9GAMM|nr:EamA family transporter [Marinomonas transparens]MBJ7536090.1 EamA family transporter [Marinomonas transparens]
MTITAIILVLISTFMHAGWNFFGKKSSPTLGFFFLTMVAGALIFSPMVFIHWELVQAFDKNIIILLFMTGLFQSFYLWGLAEAYKAGDMSIAYPIARSSPLIIVCITSFFLGQQDNVSVQAVVGIVLILFGCLFIPLQSFNEFKFANYQNRTTAFAIVAAFATAGYSLVDNQATQLMRGLTNDAGEAIASASEVALVYVTLQSTFAVFWMLWFVIITKKQRTEINLLIKNQWQAALLTGGLMLGTYALVILSMAFVDNVSYVVAFRQFSIPLGVLFAVIGFKESLKLPKIIGVSITFIGLIAVALG